MGFNFDTNKPILDMHTGMKMRLYCQFDEG